MWWITFVFTALAAIPMLTIWGDSTFPSKCSWLFSAGKRSVKVGPKGSEKVESLPSSVGMGHCNTNAPRHIQKDKLSVLELIWYFPFSNLYLWTWATLIQSQKADSQDFDAWCNQDEQAAHWQLMSGWICVAHLWTRKCTSGRFYVYTVILFFT